MAVLLVVRGGLAVRALMIGEIPNQLKFLSKQALPLLVFTCIFSWRGLPYE